MRTLYIFGSLVILLAACKKNDTSAGTAVEMYLLSSYQLVQGKCQVDSSKAVLVNTPFIGTDEIVEYTRSSFQYRLTESALKKIGTLAPRTPMAITVDKKVIFYCVYMPPILSSTCVNSIAFAESWDQTSSITMSLGYPGSLAAGEIDDQRNNARLITTLIRQGKLR